MHTFNPAQLATNDIYKLMIGIIVPRPTADRLCLHHRRGRRQKPGALQLLYRLQL